MEYVNTIWNLIIPPYNIKKLQTIKNIALRIAIGCTRDTNTQHLHNKTKILPIDTHLKLHVTQLKQLTQTQTHPLHDLNAYSDPPRNMKVIIFHNNKHTNIIISEPDITPGKCTKKTLITFTLPAPHTTSVLEKQPSY